MKIEIKMSKTITMQAEVSIKGIRADRAINGMYITEMEEPVIVINKRAYYLDGVEAQVSEAVAGPEGYETEWSMLYPVDLSLE